MPSLSCPLHLSSPPSTHAFFSPFYSCLLLHSTLTYRFNYGIAERGSVSDRPSVAMTVERCSVSERPFVPSRGSVADRPGVVPTRGSVADRPGVVPTRGSVADRPGYAGRSSVGRTSVTQPGYQPAPCESLPESIADILAVRAAASSRPSSSRYSAGGPGRESVMEPRLARRFSRSCPDALPLPPASQCLSTSPELPAVVPRPASGVAFGRSQSASPRPCRSSGSLERASRESDPSTRSSPIAMAGATLTAPTRRARATR
jgi:hypothetical protein